MAGASSQIIDAQGNVWTISSGGLVQENGTNAGLSASVIKLAYVGGEVYQENSAKNWWVWSGGTWVASADPLPGKCTSSSASSSASTSTGTSTTTTSGTTTSGTTSGPTSTGGTGVGTGAFQTSDGQIIAPNGSIYQPRGVNIWSDDDTVLSMVYTQVSTYLPGINFVRAYGPNLASADLSPNGQLVTEVNYLTARGIVVMLEDTCCTGSTPVDGTLTNLENWYSSAATVFKDNPMVWFETENEPSRGDSTDFVTQAQGLYNAIRATGNTSLVVFCVAGDLSIAPSVFSSMTNVVWDAHYYNWETGYSSDEGTIAAQIASDKATVTAFFSGPYAIFEYGESTSGMGDTGDNGGAEALAMVQNAVTSGEVVGDAYFQWFSDGVPPWTTDSIFASQGGGPGDLEGNASTCTVGGGAPTGCGPVAAAWIAESQGVVQP